MEVFNTTTVMLNTNNSNSSLTSVTAGGEENSLNTDQIVLISLAGFFLLGYALLLIFYKVFNKDIKELLQPGSWRMDRGENFLKVLILFFCLIIPTGGYLVVIASGIIGVGYLAFLLYEQIYRYCLKPTYRLCVDLKNHPKKLLDLFLFTLFNIMLNGSDVILDILTAEDLGNPTPFSNKSLTIPVYQASLGSRCGRVSPSVGSLLPSSTASLPSS